MMTEQSSSTLSPSEWYGLLTTWLTAPINPEFSKSIIMTILLVCLIAAPGAAANVEVLQFDVALVTKLGIALNSASSSLTSCLVPLLLQPLLIGAC